MINEKTKSRLITLGIVVGVVIIAFSIIFLKSYFVKDSSKDIVQCISEKAILYTQEGCSHCAAQQRLFGENKKLLNIVNCFYEGDKCQEITATPSWEINGKLYNGVYSIEELKNMTGCT